MSVECSPPAQAAALGKGFGVVRLDSQRLQSSFALSPVAG
jgi:hypothetical protein